MCVSMKEIGWLELLEEKETLTQIVNNAGRPSRQFSPIYKQKSR